MIRRQATRRAETVGVPGELQGSIPRQVRLTGGGIAVAAIAILLAASAVASVVLLSSLFQRQDQERRARAAEGIVVQAQVVNVAVTHGDHPRRLITYAYEVDGRQYTARASVDRDQERSVAAGDLVRVGYLPSDPRTTWMIGHEPGRFPPLLIPVIPLLLLLAALGIASILRRQWILLSEGRATEARIVAEKKVRRGNHSTNRVTYEFQTLSGATRTVTVDSTKKPPALGSVVPLVYHRENPRWAAAYPVPLVRPERTRSR